MVGWFNRRLRRDREDGAALVEFAFVLPFLLLLFMGIIEFSWVFAQHIDVRHGAREAGRLATVDADDVAGMTAAACTRMDFATGASVNFTDGASGAKGDTGTAQVVAPTSTLTGFFDAVLPATLTSTVSFRLEQNSDNWSTGSGSC